MAEQARFIAGRYRLLDLIGSGGMGRVWLAWDERLSRAVAVKQLRSPLELPEAEARVATERAIREGRITARLHHPHAVPIFDVVDHEGLPCLVMQYLPARSLQEIVASEGTLPPPEAARIGSEVASALAAAHDAGIVHRDVKPANILIADGTARITDFGISRVLGDSTLSATGMVTGTPAYLAPEVARGAGASPASDVFSLGATLYAAVEGTSPFGASDNPMAALHRAASGEITPPAHAGPLSPLLLHMLAASPDERPTMHEAAIALAEVAGVGSPSRMPATPEAKPARPPARAAAAQAASPAQAPPAQAPPAQAGSGQALPAQARPVQLDETQTVERRRTEMLPAATPPAPYGTTSDLPLAPLIELDEADPEPRRRHRVLPFLLAFVVVASGLFAVWAISRTGGPGEAGSSGSTPPAVPTVTRSTPQVTQPSSSPRVSTPLRTSTSARTTATREAPPPKATLPPVDKGTTTDADLVTAVRDYYGVLPGDTDAGWQLLTDRYRATTAGSRQQYQGFWDTIRSVRVGSLAGDAPAYVVGTVTYQMDDGRTIVERTSYSLVKDDGVLKIDRSSVLSSREV